MAKGRPTPKRAPLPLSDPPPYCHPHVGRGDRPLTPDRIDADHHRWARWKRLRAQQRASRRANRLALAA